MRTIIRIIDSISEYTGRTFSWVCVALIFVLVYEVTARYAFMAPTIWAHQLACMLGLTIATMGLAYTHLHHGHVRVDVFYALLPTRGKAVIDVIFGLLFLFPLLAVVTIVACNKMTYSWEIGEVLTQSHWYPPAGPVRTVAFAGLSLFILQGIAQFIRDVYLLIKEKVI